MNLPTFIENHVAEVEKIETASQLAWWNLATTGDETFSKALAEAKIELRSLYSNAQDYKVLSEFSATSDPLLARQKTLMLLQYRENQIPSDLIREISLLETGIEAIYTNFRAEVDGQVFTSNDVKRVLIESPDQGQRERVWAASKQIGRQVERQVRQLILLRNRSAKIAGYANFYTMRLELQELDETRLFDILRELEQATQGPWNTYKKQLHNALAARFGISTADLRPWHYQDPFFQEAPSLEINLDHCYKGKDIIEICRRFFNSIDLPCGDILARSDLFERKKKNQHAFCSCIDRKQDIRVLCNMRDDEYWTGTLLHELGHAVYDKFIDQRLPYLLRTYAHVSTTEASAMFFGRIARNRHFLQKFVDLPEDEAGALAAGAQRQSAATLLVFVRWALTMLHFERAMYQQPNADLNTLWWDYVERYQGVNRPEGRHAPDWASKLHLACAPVYYQNYVLGEMTASQLLHALDQDATSQRTGQFLRQRLYHLGALYPWEEALRQATGENLNPGYLTRDVCPRF